MMGTGVDELARVRPQDLASTASRMPARLLVTIVLFLCIAGPLDAADPLPAKLPGFLASDLYGDDGRSYAVGAVAGNTDGTALYVAGSYEVTGGGQGGERLWLWKIGSEGKRDARYEQSLKDLFEYVAIESMAVSNEGHLLACLRKADRSTDLVRIDPEGGAIVSALPLERGLHVSKILASGDDVLLLGHLRLDSALIKLSLGGEEK